MVSEPQEVLHECTIEFPGKSQTRGGKSRVGVPALLALRGMTMVSGKEGCLCLLPVVKAMVWLPDFF